MKHKNPIYMNRLTLWAFAAQIWGFWPVYDGGKRVCAGRAGVVKKGALNGFI
jgi:hypothetical protein